MLQILEFVNDWNDSDVVTFCIVGFMAWVVISLFADFVKWFLKQVFGYCIGWIVSRRDQRRVFVRY